MMPHAPEDFWEAHYTRADRIWSGRVNPVLADVVSAFAAGTALDLGSGEGGDALWLAERGWTVTGVDISPTAIGRARSAAESSGLGAERITFLLGDLIDLPSGPFDLVTASYLHSPVALDRRGILRRAAARVAPGGHLLLTSHANVASGEGRSAVGMNRSLTADEEISQLDLDDGEWEVVRAERRPHARPASAPQVDDIVVLLQRRH